MFVWSKEDAIVLPITLLLMLAITILLWLTLRNKEEKYRQIPLAVITITMLVLEVIKQIYYAVSGQYTTWIIPLHFCSLFLYFFPLAVFAKGKTKQFGKVMSVVTTFWLLISFYFSPGTIIGVDTTKNIFANFHSFHSFIYHHLALLFLFVSVALKYYKITYKDFAYVAIGITIYGTIAVPVAHLTNTNWCNLIKSNITMLENFRLQFGDIPYTFLLYLGGIAGGIVGCLAYIGFEKLTKLKGGQSIEIQQVKSQEDKLENQTNVQEDELEKQIQN